MFFAQPLRCCFNLLIFPCHCSIGELPELVRDHISLIISVRLLTNLVLKIFQYQKEGISDRWTNGRSSFWNRRLEDFEFLFSNVSMLTDPSYWGAR
jgi:hypothetical protein